MGSLLQCTGVAPRNSIVKFVAPVVYYRFRNLICDALS